MNLDSKAKEFAEAIKSSREFLELKQAHLEINKDPQLKKQIEDFKKKQEELFNLKPGSKKSSPKEAQEKAAELSKKFNTLSKIPQVETYLAAGANYNKMMAKVFKFISDYLEKDLKK